MKLFVLFGSTTIVLSAGVQSPAFSAPPNSIFRPILSHLQDSIPEGWVMRLPSSVQFINSGDGGRPLYANFYEHIAKFDKDKQAIVVALDSQVNCKARVCEFSHISSVRNFSGFKKLFDTPVFSLSQLQKVRLIRQRSWETFTESEKQLIQQAERALLERDPIVLTPKIRGIFVVLNGMGASTPPSMSISWEQDGQIYTIAHRTRIMDNGQAFPKDKEKLIATAKSMANGDLLYDRATEAKRAAQQQKSFQDSPDGVYFYGKSPNPEAQATDYLIFRKTGTLAVGSYYTTNTDNGECFLGIVQKNSILFKIGTHTVPMKPRPQVSYSSSDVTVYLDFFHPISTKKVPQYSKDSPQFCSGLMVKAPKDLTGNISVNQSVTSSPKEKVTTVNVPLAPISPRGSIASARPPSSQEIARVTQQSRSLQSIEKLNQFQLKDRQTLRKQANNYLAPFVGGWIASDNQRIFIYPSKRRERQACVILEKDGAQDFQIGVASGNATGTDISIGDARLFNTKQAVFALRRPGSDQLIATYAAPGSASLTENNRSSMEDNGCITSFPTTSIANSNLDASPEIATRNEKFYTWRSPEGIEFTNMNCFLERQSYTGKKAPNFCTTKAESSNFIIDQSSIKMDRGSDKSLSIEMEVFNLGAGDGLLEIYDSKGELTDIKRIDGTEPPSGFVQTISNVFTVPARLFGKYPIDDPRYIAKSTNLAGKNKIQIPRGGFIKITKTSRTAISYNSLITTIDLIAAIDSLKPSGFAAIPPSASLKEIALKFLEEANSKTLTNIFKSEPGAKGLNNALNLNNIDAVKIATLLKNFTEFIRKIESDLGTSSKPTDNPVFGAVYGVTEEIADQGIEVFADSLTLGLGRLVKITRQSTGVLNAFSKASYQY